MTATAETTRTIHRRRPQVNLADISKAKKKAMMNLVACRYLLLTTDKDEVLPPEYHYTWSSALLDGQRNTAIEGFRESGKTQIVLRAFPIYSLVFPSRDRDYIVLIKNNATLASAKLREIEHEYQTNPILSANLVKVHEESGSVFSVDVRDVYGEIINVRIEAYGKGASIRGLANQDRRPKIAIIDDPQDTEDSQSETTLEKDWEWFLSDVMFLGQNTRIFLIGNNLGERSIIERVFKNTEELKFDTYKIPAVIDGKSAWPEKYNIQGIEEDKENYRKLGKLDIWFREKMCEAIADETRRFKREDFRYYSVSTMTDIISRCNIFIPVDLAISGKRDADYTALPIVGIDFLNNWFILDVIHGHLDPTQTIDSIFASVSRWKALGVGIEKVAYQRALIHFITREMATRGIFFPVHELAAEKQKEIRIMALQPRFRAHTIWFPDHAPWLTELESELLMFPKGEHDDIIDALAYLPVFGYPKDKTTMKRDEIRKMGLNPNIVLGYEARKEYDPFAE